MNLILTRHGQTIWNTELRTQGRTDIPLSDEGRAQSERLAMRLAAQNACQSITAIYSSPLSRAMETARACAAVHALVPQPTELMLERNFGVWEGEAYESLREKYPAQIALWEADPLSYTPPEAEPLCEVLARCMSLLDLLQKSCGKTDTVLLVGHSVPLRLIIAHLIGLPMQHMHNIRLDNASYTELRIASRRNTLFVLNDTSHLMEGTCM